ncbi:MAG: pantoate--beta-alanine ligase [Candidatus Omnitrophica bacterium]|nr:pantoate--beta-alanine ligase [Candidatus Omnitrophota bacterium]
MQLITQARQMVLTAQALHRKGRTIGFVPTMGALHDGHLSLLRAAHRDTQVVVLSVFVNPLQFGPQEDYARYPRDLKHDLRLTKPVGCDIVFAPDVSHIYPTGFRTHVEVSGLGDRLEGLARPGHFRGVATVVAKLFSLVQPAVAYVGQKDYQQALVIQRLVKDLNYPVSIRLMPIVREPDGLAMSSRNVFLSPDERRQAPVLYQALQRLKMRIREGERDAKRLIETARETIARQPSARIDYLAIVDAKTLEPLTLLRGRVAVLAAVRFGATRLIDNILVEVP